MPAPNLLTAETLCRVGGGGVGVLINQKLRAAQLDVEDLPQVTKARKVVIEVALTPPGEKDDPGTINVDVTVKATVPARGASLRTVPTTEGLRSDSLAQRTFDESKKAA